MKNFAKTFLIVLGVLAISVPAEACRIRRNSILYTNFHLLNSGVMDAILDDDVYVGIAEVVLTKAGDAFTHIPTKGDPVILRQSHVRFQFVKMLSGQAPKSLFLSKESCTALSDTDEEKCVVSPITVSHPQDLDQGEVAQYAELKAKITHRLSGVRSTFDFYDRMPLSIPEMEMVLEGDNIIISCGPVMADMVQPDLQYLIVGQGSNILSAEPLSTAHDPLVSLVTDIVTHSETSALSISPEDFFAHFDYFEHVEIASCDLNTQKDINPIAALHRKKYNNGTLKHLKFGRYNPDKHATHWQVVSAYYNQNRATNETFPCKTGDEYLAIYKSPTPNNGRHTKVLPAHTLFVKFMKVKDGVVSIPDLMTYYKVDQSKPVTTKMVMDWIDGATHP